MAEEIEKIQYINIGDGKNHPIDAVTLDGKSSSDFQETNNLVTEISSSSDDSHYPSAKCVWDAIGDIESALETI